MTTGNNDGAYYSIASMNARTKAMMGEPAKETQTQRLKRISRRGYNPMGADMGRRYSISGFQGKIGKLGQYA